MLFRSDDAREELDEVLRDFPELAELAQQRKDLAALAAARLLDEVLVRGRVGQDGLALDLLEVGLDRVEDLVAKPVLGQAEMDDLSKVAGINIAPGIALA